MKVLVIFTYGYSLKTWHETGTLERELSIYKELTKKDIQFTFLTYGNIDEHTLLKNQNNMSVIPIYETKSKSKFKIFNLIHSFLIPFYIKRNKMNFDLIKHNQLLGSWVGIILKFLLRKPLFIRTGYDMYLFSLYENKKILIKTLYKILTQISIWVTDLYSVSSFSDLKFLKKTFNGTEKITVRPNWIINSQYKNFNSRESNRILAVGRLENQKNFKYLINSFTNSDFVIDIVGNGSQKDILLDYAKRKNVEVNIIEKIENIELNNLYTKYKYFISSSKYEGNPKTVLEAMSNGCVVFASNIPNHKELIKNGVNGFLFELNSNNLNKIFNSNINDMEKLSKISKSAFQFVEKNNSLEKMTFEEYKDYDLLINRT